MSGVQVSTTVNGDVEEFVCHPGETLLDVLRNRLGLTGAKEGCGTGDCGANRMRCGVEDQNRRDDRVEPGRNHVTRSEDGLAEGREHEVDGDLARIKLAKHSGSQLLCAVDHRLGVRNRQRLQRCVRSFAPYTREIAVRCVKRLQDRIRY